MQKDSESPVRLLSYADDQPNEGKGSLIPQKPHQFAPASAVAAERRSKTTAATSMMALFVLAAIGFGSYGVISGQANLASVPAIVLTDELTRTSTPLEFGPHPALANQDFFAGLVEAFVDEEMSFVEVDLTQRQLRLFKKGVLFQSEEVLGLPASGSWWETPSGLYKIEQKKDEVFSNIGQAHLPWAMTFHGNYLLHGWPTYPDGSAVETEFVAGGIRLSDEAAQDLYEHVPIGTPILIHQNTTGVKDTFVYEPDVIELDTPHYFVSDIGNHTILATTDLDEQMPIASLTKLMTAVVASERINLDGRIQVTSPSFVTSLIPRLSERASVSMYSLMQLLLVESSNEAAETIAGEIGRDDFIAAMNAKARQLGMLNTTFADPSGLSEDNVSTLSDLLRLTEYIYEDKRFIFEITSHEKPVAANVGGEFSGLVNFNEIENIDSFIGGKVGETLAAGQTSISLHRVTIKGEERTLVVMVLGSENRNEDITALLTYVQNRFGR